MNFRKINYIGNDDLIYTPEAQSCADAHLPQAR